MALRTPTKAAEAIKINHACALQELANPDEMLEVISVNERPGRKISAKILADVVSARYEELFTLVRHELRRSGFENRIAAGMVISGGGSCVRGAIELAELCFEMPVRQGCAHHVAGLVEATTNPSLATGVGLLLHGFQQQYEGGYSVPALNEGGKSMWSRMREWFQGNF